MKHKNLQIDFPAIAARKSSDTSDIGYSFVPRHDPRTERELDLITGLSERRRVSLPFGKIAAILLEAAKTNRVWPEDFGDDLVEMDADLYEILMAYEDMHNSDMHNSKAA